MRINRYNECKGWLKGGLYGTCKGYVKGSDYNELGFSVGNPLMILVESQSTWTRNIIIRVLQVLKAYARDIEDSPARDIVERRMGEKSCVFCA